MIQEKEILRAASEHADYYRKNETGNLNKTAYSSFWDGVEWVFKHLWHDASETPSIFGTYMLMHDGGWCVARYYGKGITSELSTGWAEVINNIPIDHPQKWLDLSELRPKQEG